MPEAGAVPGYRLTNRLTDDELLVASAAAVVVLDVLDRAGGGTAVRHGHRVPITFKVDARLLSRTAAYVVDLIALSRAP
jgi:hypothetical protein